MSQPYGQNPYGHQPPSQPYPPQPPGYGYGNPPGPPPRRRKSSAPTVLIILGVVAVIFFGGCAAIIAALGSAGSPSSTSAAIDQADADEDEPKATQKTSRPKKAGAPKIGSTVRDGKFAFTVTKTERRARVGSEFLGAEAQGVFLLVHITVENIGDEAQAFTSSAQKLYANGKEYEADSSASIYLEGSKSFYEKINPGNSVRGVVLFDIPENLTPETIDLHDSIFSDGVRVSLS
ncbi:DUF4352 domain-containing protein [Nonomuraea sp. NPDC049419]|uniref:DUF4352 domain-containing protein n=1 Tax=Nonomuraea sp. NPDC049419 TaxID=3155772 RepID=UPI003439DCEE